MIKNIKKHYWHYLVYALLFGGGILLILFTRSNRTEETLCFMMIGVLYFIWAMVHHYVHHKLQPRIVFEYLLIVILGVVLVLFLIGV